MSLHRLLSLLALVALISAPLLAQEKAERDGDREIKLKDAPLAVRAAIEKHAKGAEVEEIEVEEEGGITVYSVEVERGETEWVLEFSADGVLLAREVELDDEALPKAVLTGLRTRFPGARMTEATWCHRTVYEVSAKVGRRGAEREWLFDGLGRQLEGEEVPEFGELPPAVRAAVAAHSGLGALAEIEACPARHETSYEISLEQDGRETSMVITASGDLVEVERSVPLAEVPAAVLAAFSKASRDAKPLETEVVEQYCYEIDIVHGGLHIEVSFDATGRLLDD